MNVANQKLTRKLFASKASENNQYCTQFQKRELASLKDLAKLCAEGVWIPGVFNGGRRNLVSWESADFIALDFDDGTFSLQQAVKTFCDCACIVGTTRSHQKEKNGRINDRFRVVFKLQTTCTSLEDYRYNVQNLITEYDADWSCHDPSHLFFPCREIVYIGDDDGFETPIHAKPLWIRKQENIRTKMRLEHYRKFGEFPRYVADFLSKGECYNGGRNSTAISVSLFLCDTGDFSKDEIRRMITSAPIDRKDLRHRELENIVDSAFRKKERERNG